LFLFCGLISCSRTSPQVLFERDYQSFVRGDLAQSQAQAHRDSERFQKSDREWSWKFRILEAQSLIWRGMYQEVLQLLVSGMMSPPADKGTMVEIFAIEGVAHARQHEFSAAESVLVQAAKICQASLETTCGDLSRAFGVLNIQRDQIDAAKKYFEQSLQFARSHGDRFLEETALLNLGATALLDAHYDEAIDWSEAAYKSALALEARGEAQADLGNLGWAYYALGDFDRSLEISLEAQKGAIRSGNAPDELYWATNVGYVYASLGNFDRARESCLHALDVARRINGTEGIYNALRALALISVEQGALQQAQEYSDEAAAIAHKIGHAKELYPLLVQGQIAAQQANFEKAKQIFQQIEGEPILSLKWQAQDSLARLYQAQMQPVAADREYRAAIATFKQARANVTHKDFQLSFLTNGSRIYDDYVHFLVVQGKQDDALRWADYSRARTLSEGFSRASNGTDADVDKKILLQAPALQERAIAAHTKAAILYYWLGEKQSYLWAITPRETRLFTLPNRREIEGEVERYRKALIGPVDVLQSANPDGSSLYRTLIAPAQSLLPKDARVFIIPDGSLNNINFETLIAPDPAPHFWIEDATITDASSLRMLNAFFHRKTQTAHRNLLLIGNSIAPNDQYPALPNAQDQMENVARHFPDAQRQVFSGAAATPESYLENHPERFSRIHFVAHGIASRLSPLDSAIVLSKNPAETDSFKLYAREILRHPLHADLVTISACYGAGERAYSGEGLVGLAWAFLRAGAHNVIAGLWAVTDASTAQMMDRFYDELDKGEGPDTALRNAKLSLLHGSAFHNPFYWAPFQLYAGS
jgi:CHAT domain-containing protein/tetratricopeptide (TPR) repeat protein